MVERDDDGSTAVESLAVCAAAPGLRVSLAEERMLAVRRRMLVLTRITPRGAREE